MRRNDGASRAEEEQARTSAKIPEQDALASPVQTFSRTRAAIPFRIVPVDYEGYVKHVQREGSKL